VCPAWSSGQWRRNGGPLATLAPASPQPTVTGQVVIPGQLDLLQLLDPTDSNDPQEHQ